MVASPESEPVRTSHRTTTRRKSDREPVTTEALVTVIEGMDEAMPETFEQLHAFLAARLASQPSSSS